MALQSTLHPPYKLSMPRAYEVNPAFLQDPTSTDEMGPLEAPNLPNVISSSSKSSPVSIRRRLRRPTPAAGGTMHTATGAPPVQQTAQLLFLHSQKTGALLV